MKYYFSTEPEKTEEGKERDQEGAAVEIENKVSKNEEKVMENETMSSEEGQTKEKSEINKLITAIKEKDNKLEELQIKVKIMLNTNVFNFACLVIN